MTELNIVILEGRVSGRCDLLYTKSGNAMCQFNLAVGEDYKVDEETKHITSFITINIWGRDAEKYAKNLIQGKKIRVQGSINQNNWVDKDGKSMSNVYVNATAIDFLGE